MLFLGLPIEIATIHTAVEHLEEEVGTIIPGPPRLSYAQSHKENIYPSLFSMNAQT